MMKWILFLLVLTSNVARAAPALLALNRDGTVSRWESGKREQLASVPGAIDIATCNNGVTWVLTPRDVHAISRAHGAPKPRKYRVEHGVALACAVELYVAVAGGHVSRLPAVGASKVIAELGTVRFLFVDATRAFAATEHALVGIEHDEKYALAGLPIAAAANAQTIYVIDRDGGFHAIDRKTRATSDLNLGPWWGTLGLVATDSELYIATQVGKLWRIKPAAHEKEMLEDEGWQPTLSLIGPRPTQAY
jgi:hypothetical protein